MLHIKTFLVQSDISIYLKKGVYRQAYFYDSGEGKYWTIIRHLVNAKQNSIGTICTVHRSMLLQSCQLYSIQEYTILLLFTLEVC
jgi:hypothetical protein